MQIIKDFFKFLFTVDGGSAGDLFLSEDEEMLLQILEDGKVWDAVDLIRHINTITDKYQYGGIRNLYYPMVDKGLIHWQEGVADIRNPEPDLISITTSGHEALVVHRQAQEELSPAESN